MGNVNDAAIALGHVSGAMDCGVLEEIFDLPCNTVPLMREVKTWSCECVQLIEKKKKEKKNPCDCFSSFGVFNIYKCAQQVRDFTRHLFQQTEENFNFTS